MYKFDLKNMIVIKRIRKIYLRDLLHFRIKYFSFRAIGTKLYGKKLIIQYIYQKI